MKNLFPILFLCAIALAATPATGEVLAARGTPGVAGADGADGNPGDDGEQGGDGLSVEAVADVVGEANTASAVGGRGGTGGDGGDGVLPGAGAGDGAGGGAGGDATARAIGSGSWANATAIGGHGGASGEGGGAVEPGSDGLAGSGGDAKSSASAWDKEGVAVDALSIALGGAGGNAMQTGAGGDAAARAKASGYGPVDAWARAVGGDSANGSAGNAFASAEVVGASGIAHAEAETGSGAHAKLRARTIAFLTPQEPGCCPWRSVSAETGDGVGLMHGRPRTGRNGDAFFTTDPLQADLDAAAADNPALGALLDDAHTDVLALARWHGTANPLNPLALTTELELVLSDTDASAQLVLAAFGISVLGDAFGSLSFELAKNGVALGAGQRFDSAAAALDYFSDTVLDLGSGWVAGDELLARFELEVGPDTQFEIGLGFATASAPEPGTALLFALGLAVLARRRRVSA